MQIFLSSTYVDLKEYRAKARQAIEESGNEFVGMETFQSHTHEPSEFCPERVEECDALVLLVAYRYGNIPDGETRSITQLEYEHALKNKIPVRIYLTDDAFSCSPSVVDENRECINGFRTLLLKNHTCSYFSTPEGLYEKLTSDLKQFPVPPYTANPYALQANFTGRVAERRLLSEWLTKDPHPMLSLIAFGGMGKSALAWYWLMEDVKGSDEQPKKILWWSFYDIESGFERFLKKAIEYFSDEEVDWNKLPSTRDRMEHLYTLLRDNRYLLVLDGVERVLRAYAGMGSPYQGDAVKEDERGDYRSYIDPNCGMFFQWLATDRPRTKTLLTSRLFPKELDDLEGSVRKDLTKMAKEDAVNFFRRQGVKGTRAEIEEACGAYDYHPLSLTLLSGMIVHDMKYGGDIKAWTKHNPLPELKGTKKEHHILDLAYNSLDKKKQQFISRLAAFRNPMDYDAIAIFNEFGTDEKFNEVLLELADRSMLFRDEKRNTFDLHPIVRKYCYDRLTDKKNVHSNLSDYFAVIPPKEKIESVDDLAPVIELYHHTVRAGRYDEAFVLFRDRLEEQLFWVFGAYQTIIELLRSLFPDDDKLPKLKKERDQAWTLNELAMSYSLSGQSRRAIQLYKMSIEVDEKRDDNKNVAVGLGNLAIDQIIIGELTAAESNLRWKVEISRKIDDPIEAWAHRELGRLLAYRGEFEESEKELVCSLNSFTKLNALQPQCVALAFRSIRSLLMSNADEALESAIKARELADIEGYERDIIRAEYLLGAAYVMKGNFAEAEKHLNEALTKDRKINLVEMEPYILLEFAKLRFQQNYKKEALKFGEEALQIADRCEYRLKQADIHNFLAEFYLDAGELEKAKEHAEIAKERAECGYVPALKKAEKLLEEIERR